jgi:hypothetical protein
MRPSEKIESSVKKMNFSAGAELRKHILADALKAHEQTETQPAFEKPNIWRIIMKSKSTRLATAAVLFIATVAGLSILSITSKPAWAIEQTIEALRHIKAVHISGVGNCCPEGNRNTVEMWMRPNSTNPDTTGDFRYQEGQYFIHVASEEKNLTYVYYSWSGTGGVVYISEGLNRRGGGLFPGSDWFEQLKRQNKNWQEEYRKDEVTGRDSVFVTLEWPVDNMKYWLMQFDLESKLPVRAAVWYDERRQGTPRYEYSFIEYNPELPADFFEFDIPEGAQVVDCRGLRDLLDSDSNTGIAVENMSEEEACRQVGSEYWSAVIAKDWVRLQKIRPLVSEEELNELLGLYDEDEPVALIEIAAVNHFHQETFAEVTCVLKTKSGQTKTSILNVEIRNKPPEQVGAVAGTIGPELF